MPWECLSDVQRAMAREELVEVLNMCKEVDEMDNCST